MAFYVGDALKEIKKIKAKSDGHLDFDTMPPFAVRNDSNGVPGRDLGAMISMLTVAIQQMTVRVEELEKRLSAR